MRLRIRIRRTVFQASVSGLILCNLGCGQTCTLEVIVDAGSQGSLIEGSSATLADIRADGGEVGLTFENITAERLGVDLSPVQGGNVGCVTVTAEATLIEQAASVGVSIEMKCPPSAGSFSLPDLAATLCDDSHTCTALTGTVEVQQYRAVCSDYSCGSISLTLDLPVATGSGPFLSGTASVWTIYGGEKDDCSTTGSSLGGFVD